MSVMQIGTHRITNASIEDPVVDQMLQGRVVKVMYSDPPWGDGNLKYWVTINKKMTGATFQPLTYERLIERLINLARKYVRGCVFLETGVRWEAMLCDRLKSAGFHDVHPYRTTYANNLPQSLVASSTLENVSPRITMSDYAPVPALCNIVKGKVTPGDTILDPCCGMGFTAQAAINLGLRFCGNEFNAARLAKTIRRLQSGEVRNS